MARILIINNDENVNNMLVEVLLNAGYEAERVNSYEHGLNQLETKSFDLIITDIILPGKEELEIILTFRKRNKIVPIIVISGSEKIGPEIYLEMVQVSDTAFTFQKLISIAHFLIAVRMCLMEKMQKEQTPNMEKADQKARRIAIGVASWLCGTLEGLASDNADLALAESLDFWLRLQKKNSQTLYIGSVACVSCGRSWECMALSNSTDNVQCPHCNTIQKITLNKQTTSCTKPENKESLEKIKTEVQYIITKIAGLNQSIKDNYEKKEISHDCKGD